MEFYEERNQKETFSFSEYCEETALLNKIKPEQLIVFTKDAEIQIKDYSISHVDALYGKDFQSEKENRCYQQTNQIINDINEYNKTHNRLWRAGRTSLSHRDFVSRRRIMGIPTSNSSLGLEYYAGGIFEIGRDAYNYSYADSSKYVDNWDWRNVRGVNWMTCTKDQGDAGYCVAFAAAGCLEALVNLYYNRKIDMDLSEMEIVCCSDTFPHLPNQGLSVGKTLNYIVQHGLCDEDSYPYHITLSPSCISDSITPLEIVRPSGQFDVLGNAKSALIKHGPVIADLSQGIFSPGHAMVLVGYGTLHENDNVFAMYDYDSLSFANGTIGPDDPRIGKTFWILKNSWGTHPNNADGEYMYIIDHTARLFNVTHSFRMPFTTLNYSEGDIVIEDLDGDGYYNWGLGPKPSICPAWIPDERDDDDSNPEKHYMDIYGNFPEVRTFPEGTEIVLNDMTISRKWDQIKDMEINHGVTVTITESVYCYEKVKITICGGTLIIDGGILANADIRLMSQSKIIIRNGGSIYLKRNANFIVPSGCTLEIEDGNILPPFKNNPEI